MHRLHGGAHVGEAGEDDVRRAEKHLDELTSKHVAHVDDLLKHKEAERLTDNVFAKGGDVEKLMDEGDPKNFKTNGHPKAAVVNKAMGETIGTDEREAAWESILNS